MNFMSYLGLALTMVNGIASSIAMLAAGQPAVLPEIRTYFSGKHIGINITVNPLP